MICQPSGSGCGPNNGGTCSKNTGITTSLNYEASSFIRTTLVLAHEVGHNFGADQGSLGISSVSYYPSRVMQVSSGIDGVTMPNMDDVENFIVEVSK